MRPTPPVLAALVALAATGCASTNQQPEASQLQLGRPIQTAGPPPDRPRPSRSVPATSPSLKTSERVAPKRLLPTARRTAFQFFTSYVRYLYGGLPGADVRGVSPRLHSELRRRSALITPAERDAVPRISHIRAVAAGPPVSVTATAS